MPIRDSSAIGSGPPSSGACLPCVAVIIPVFNGERTIDATLASARGQTWPNIEIIVVDDGSTDNTRGIVEQHQLADSRVRLISQRNLGVAAARNRGISATSADFIAPLDADDLWAPQKITLQMEKALSGGNDVGLVYTWFARIDVVGSVIRTDHRPMFEGRILNHMCRGNFIANGSSPLIRRRTLDRVGGYDESLRARDAQGCEDLLLYLRIAEVSEFRVVPQPLTGYRLSPSNMSSDILQMFRSGELVIQEYMERLPQYSAELRLHRQEFLFWQFARAMLAKNVGAARTLARVAWSRGEAPSIVGRGCLIVAARLGHFAQRTVRQRREFAQLNEPCIACGRSVGAG
jgi:glycosyltransferase involved in cell wall biosynthesis